MKTPAPAHGRGAAGREGRAAKTTETLSPPRLGGRRDEKVKFEVSEGGRPRVQGGRLRVAGSGAGGAGRDGFEVERTRIN